MFTFFTLNLVSRKNHYPWSGKQQHRPISPGALEGNHLASQQPKTKLGFGFAGISGNGLETKKASSFYSSGGHSFEENREHSGSHGHFRGNGIHFGSSGQFHGGGGGHAFEDNAYYSGHRFTGGGHAFENNEHVRHSEVHRSSSGQFHGSSGGHFESNSRFHSCVKTQGGGGGAW